MLDQVRYDSRVSWKSDVVTCLSLSVPSPLLCKVFHTVSDEYPASCFNDVLIFHACHMSLALTVIIFFCEKINKN